MFKRIGGGGGGGKGFLNNVKKTALFLFDGFPKLLLLFLFGTLNMGNFSVLESVLP